MDQESQQPDHVKLAAQAEQSMTWQRETLPPHWRAMYEQLQAQRFTDYDAMRVLLAYIVAGQGGTVRI